MIRGGRILALLIATMTTGVLCLAQPARTQVSSDVQTERGFNAPTLDGDWRFRIDLNGWIPDSIPVTVNAGNRSGTKTVDIGFLLDHLGYAIPIDVEVRKGSFGAYVHTMAFKFVGSIDAGPAVIRFDQTGFLMDAGLSYELGSWNLGEGAGAPVLTVEPFAGARLYYSPVDLNFPRIGRSTTIDSFTNYVPDIGIRTFWDLTEHWNLRVEGDGGGFGVDDNQQTWQAVGLVGYRWPGWGVGWNLQVGYRAMRLFDLKKDAAEVQLDFRGPDVIIGVEF